ncbi:MAG: hypothetical protein AUJ37_01490 [Candidatus Magasanikbacteria bacterium CG1_02_41_34]|nr:MAG: hypothetical protein AUJ37_01490 [Candidatus Magasanikbacteria bacterium CG1_02_41_34]
MSNDFVKNAVVKQIGEENGDLYDLVPIFLGFSEPQTYLIEFLNNTELRPGGGFIGSYAVVSIDRGQVTIDAIDGTENLDRNAPLSLLSPPPAPLETHLGVTKWFFRDSNWSPDFKESALQGLSLYRTEGGVMADSIDGIIGITPTVLERLLKVVGSVTVQGNIFTAENVTEKLEYEVEYAYEDKGIHVQDRKDILEPLFLEVMNRLKQNIITKYPLYLETFTALANEKQILFYHTDADVNAILATRDWTGSVVATDGDYVQWVDANLGSLKTDYALDRTLSYAIIGKREGRYIAQATMTYVHRGTFDWRTTRYITYSRVYAPLGSIFQSVQGTLKSGDAIQSSQVNMGEDLGKSWFGTSFSIEPGQTKILQFTYLLPASFSEQDTYHLLVQKQAGTIDHALTLDLDFATLLQSAEPPEVEGQRRDGKYVYTTDLSVDREFFVQL